MTKKFVLALPKGRILQDVQDKLVESGIITASFLDAKNRQLYCDSPHFQQLRVCVVRSFDVPTFVSYGGADFGICGSDVVLECGYDNCIELVDFGISKCRLMSAKHKSLELDTTNPLKVATKFPRLSRDFFRKKQLQTQLIKLHGAMELSALLGMTDMIVDLVDTGTTLKMNGLEALETIYTSSARLITHEQNYKVYNKASQKIADYLQEAIGVG